VLQAIGLGVPARRHGHQHSNPVQIRHDQQGGHGVCRLPSPLQSAVRRCPEERSHRKSVPTRTCQCRRRHAWCLYLSRMSSPRGMSRGAEHAGQLVLYMRPHAHEHEQHVCVPSCACAPCAGRWRSRCQMGTHGRSSSSRSKTSYASPALRRCTWHRYAG
jgi:hypothetical protein